MAYSVALIPGDGIGPEVTDAAVVVLETTGVPLAWERCEAGAEIAAKYGTPLPEVTLEAIRTAGVALKGPLTTQVGAGMPSVNGALRKALDLYACYRPVKSLPGVPSRYEGIDFVVFRENTEDLYSGIEHIVVPGVVETLKSITERASLRIAEFTFAYAARERRKRVTVVHKANIMKLSDGLFLECARRVAKKYQAIQYEELIVDKACMQLVRDPGHFDVLLMENLYGDIISDLGAGLVGGLGVVPGANLGDRYAVFEAVHGSAPDIAGRGLANPLACILCGALLLKHLGEGKAGEAVEAAVREVLAAGRSLTPDLGGTASTVEMAEAVAKTLRC